MVNFDELPGFQNTVAIVALFLLCGFIIHPICFISYGVMYILRNTLDLTDSQYETFNVLFAVSLLIGSVCGVLIADIIFSPFVALCIALMVNGGISIILWFFIFFSHTQSILLKMIFCIYGITAGMIGPILVTIITDAVDDTQLCFGTPFIYAICCCHIAGSLFWLYEMRLMNHFSILLVVSVICTGIAFFILVMMKLRLKHYFLFKGRTRKGYANLVPKRILFLVPAGLLIFFVNILETSVQGWVHSNLTLNQTNITVHVPFDAAIWFPQGSVIIWLIPFFIVFGIKLCPIPNLLLACLSVTVAFFLWPYIGEVDFLINGTNVTKKSNSDVVVSQVIYEMDYFNSPSYFLLDGLFMTLIFGKLMFILTIFIITNQSVDERVQYIPKATCFILYYLVYALSNMFPMKFLDVIELRLILFVILAILFISLVIFFSTEQRKTTLEHSTDNYSGFEEPADIDKESEMRANE